MNIQYSGFFDEEKNKRENTAEHKTENKFENKPEYSKKIKPFIDFSISNEYKNLTFDSMIGEVKPANNSLNSDYKNLTFDSTFYDLDYKNQIIKLSQDLNKVENNYTESLGVDNSGLNDQTLNNVTLNNSNLNNQTLDNNNCILNNPYIEEELTVKENYINNCINKEVIQKLILYLPGEAIEKLTDGYHSFKELYDFRRAYNSALFNLIHETNFCKVWKSYKHYEGDLCFGGDWFIVVAELPTGQISNHYENKYWNDFNIPATEKSLIKWDNHEAKDVLERLTNLFKNS